MPQIEQLKGIASAAATGAERLVYSYPTRFSDIEAAKAYIGSICTINGYTYGMKWAMSGEDETYVRDRVHFLVATRAFAQGEFYLNTPLPDRLALRKAIEADVQRVLQLIQRWPRHFFNVYMAINYIASACTLEKFVYTPFEDVAPEKFRRYVHFHAARHAFQNGVFEMRWPPGEWVKKDQPQMRVHSKVEQRPDPIVGVLKPLGTLLETIKADIARLTPLLPPWPPSFLDLNAARNFVSQSAFEIHFRYTGWHNLELNRFRLFVNFNTARDAWQEGKFAVGMQPGSAEVGKMKIEKQEQGEEGGSRASSVTLFEEKVEHGNGSSLLTRNWRIFIEGRARAESSAAVSMTIDTNASASTSADIVTLPPPTESHEASDPLDPLERSLAHDVEAVQMPDVEDLFKQLVAVTRDPFKDLLMEFGRAGVLKTAFA